MTTTSPAGIGLRSERGPVLLALMLSTALVALDATIIATASATIARELGGFAQLPWLFSSYLLAQAVGTPVFGRLSDVLGRKRLMLAGSPCSSSGRCCAGSRGRCRRSSRAACSRAWEPVR